MVDLHTNRSCVIGHFCEHILAGDAFLTLTLTRPLSYLTAVSMLIFSTIQQSSTYLKTAILSGFHFAEVLGDGSGGISSSSSKPWTFLKRERERERERERADSSSSSSSSGAEPDPFLSPSFSPARLCCLHFPLNELFFSFFIE